MKIRVESTFVLLTASRHAASLSCSLNPEEIRRLMASYECLAVESMQKHEELEFSFWGAKGRAVGRVPIFVLAALVLVAIAVVIFVSSAIL